MARRYQRRRGIVILVVLSLLVLFVILAVTFALVTAQYKRAAVATSHQQLLGVDPEKDVDKGFYQLMRGTPIPGSSVRFHELLRDMYGEDGFTGTLAGSAPMTLFNANAANYPAAALRSGGQCVALVVNSIGGSTDGLPYTFSRIPGYYNGCVLTITSGKAKNLSTRIISSYIWFNSQNASDPFNNRPILRVMALATDDGTPITPAELGGATFVVNGRPFSGTGFGYNSGAAPADPKLNQELWDDAGNQTGLELALLPNYSTLHKVFDSLGNPHDNVQYLLNGGSDEGYDAPDFQNLAMAIIQTRPGVGIDRMPSFHRPALVRYWRNREQSLWQNDISNNFKRQFILRPIEPNFDGSNPDYRRPPMDYSVTPPVFDSTVPSWYEMGPWDVDNDGDGIRDSIWIDLGLPIQTAADGRKYRPLFAIMCLDMDGRLNVNAHGRLAMYTPNPPASNGNAATPLIYHKGMGYGPPEIDLRWTGITGNLTGLLATRYGPDGRPGAPNTFDRLARIRLFEEPTNYFTGAGGRSSYSSPSDLRGELAFGVNVFGQPMFELLPNVPAIASRGDSPYELNLLDGAAGDDPYTPAELERLYRRFDHDRNLLPNRLAKYITNLQTSGNALLVTTNSFDVPMPSISAPPELLNYINSNGLSAHNVIDLLIARLHRGGVTNPSAIRVQLARMLSPDLALGLRFNLNRPFGNGRDGSAAGGLGSGTVDEPAVPPNTELQNSALHTADNAVARAEFANVPIWLNDGFPEPDMDNNGVVDDLNGDGNVDQTDRLLSQVLVRQRYARHLYVLMLTVMDHGTTGGIPNAPASAVADEVAQWAVNVVDFRDADSIMTPFEYDPNPFDGWSDHVDGVINGYFGMVSNDAWPNTERRVVWGCERPELLLTEAVAFHARRTSDAATDTSGRPNHDTTAAPPNTDTDYDQKYLPFASAFVEMYNPWAGTDTNTTPPWELYGNSGGVQLNRTTPGGNPVWRLLIVDQNDANLPPGAVATNSLNPDASGAMDADRAVYFVDNPANLPPRGPAHGRRQYYTDQGVAPIPPGRYAVVGGGVPIGGEWVSPVGDIDPSTNGTDGQRIVLVPNANQVRVHPGTIDPNTGQPAPPEVAQAVAIVANLSTVDPATRVQTAFSVSEPRDGYPITAGGAEFNASNRPNLANRPVPYSYGAVYEDPGALTPLPYDKPLDKENPQFPLEVGTTDGTNRAFCRVYLQRLANPLLDYHAQANPYRTIDSIPMDLTVFNGLEGFPSGDPSVSNTPGVDFSCLQRGDSDPPTSRLRLWPQEPARRAAPAQNADPNSVMYFKYVLAPHSLGSRNDKYTPLPNGTFPWFVWNNRPFVSPYELMHVPRFNCWNLLRTYVDPADPMVDPDGWVRNFHLPSDNPPGYNAYDGRTPEYRHLLNLFHSTGNLPPHNRPPHYYRIFDYVHVPSRFVGTDTVLNPDFFGKTTHFPQPNPVTLGFLPPFNRVSKYRVPGLVNINTIPDAAVWNAIRGADVLRDVSTGAETPVYHGPDYSAIFSSREGGASPGTPTLFAAPFRPVGSGNLVPLASMVRNGIQGTLLRPGSGGAPLMDVSNMDPAHHSRNSFFRYELLHRLGNMVTTRSNVYAIWITVGYFEMEPNYNAAGQVVYDVYHPEGLRVGQEIGIDTGEVRRHRAFYIVDRTIPVAFQPGENHNVDKCVLLRRFIE